MNRRPTPSQTVGPFFRIGLRDIAAPDLTASEAEGEEISIQGRVLDADRKPVPDALLEFWQADARGKYHHPEDAQDKPLQAGFRGFARISTDDEGRFRLITIKPGRVPGPNQTMQAPHIVVSVFMRGLLKHCLTRIYFPDETSNTHDLILALVDPQRRPTLIAKNVPGHDGTLEWNVICAGDGETVFFDY